MPSLPSFFKTKPSFTARLFVKFETEAYQAGKAFPYAEAHLTYKKDGMHIRNKPVHGFFARRETDRNVKRLIKLLKAGASDAEFGENAWLAITALQALRKQKGFSKEQLKQAMDPVSTQKLCEAAKAQVNVVEQTVASVQAGETVEARPDADPAKKTPDVANAQQTAAYGEVKTWADILLYECPAASGESQFRSAVEQSLESRLIEKTENKPAVKGLTLANMHNTLLVEPQRRWDELLKGLGKEIDLAMKGDHSPERHQRICNCCELLRSHIAATIDTTMAASQLFANQLPRADFSFQVQQMLAHLGERLAKLASAYADPDGAMMQTYRMALKLQSDYEAVPTPPSTEAAKLTNDRLHAVEELYKKFERLCLPPSPNHGDASTDQQRVFDDLKQGLFAHPDTQYLPPAFVRKNLFNGTPERVKFLYEQLTNPKRGKPLTERKIQAYREELGRLIEREIAQLDAVGTLLLQPLPGEPLPLKLALSREEAGRAMKELAHNLRDKNGAWQRMTSQAKVAEVSVYGEDQLIQDLADLQDIPAEQLREQILSSPRRMAEPEPEALPLSDPFVITTGLSDFDLALLQRDPNFKLGPLPVPPRPVSSLPERTDLPRFSLRRPNGGDEVVRSQKAPRKRQDARGQMGQTPPATVARERPRRPAAKAVGSTGRLAPANRPPAENTPELDLAGFLQKAYTPAEGSGGALNADQQKVQAWLDEALKVQAWLDGALKGQWAEGVPRSAELATFFEEQRKRIETARLSLKFLQEAKAPPPAKDLLSVAGKLSMLIDAYMTLHHRVMELLLSVHVGLDLSPEWMEAARQAGKAMERDDKRMRSATSDLMTLREHAGQTVSRAVQMLEGKSVPPGPVLASPREPEGETSPLSPRSQSRSDMQSALSDLTQIQRRSEPLVQEDASTKDELSELFGEIEAGLTKKPKQS